VPYERGQDCLSSTSFPGFCPEGEGHAMPWAAGLEAGVGSTRRSGWKAARALAIPVRAEVETINIDPSQGPGCVL